MSFDLKAWLDQNVVATLLKDRKHQLQIHSVITGANQHGQLGMIVVWLKSEEFGLDLLGLLELPDSTLDFMRYPMKTVVGQVELVLFGSDGMPTITKRPDGSALAQARLLRRKTGEPDLVIELFMAAAPGAAVVAVRSFYDLAKERHHLDPAGVMERWAAK